MIKGHIAFLKRQKNSFKQRYGTGTGICMLTLKKQIRKIVPKLKYQEMKNMAKFGNFAIA